MIIRSHRHQTEEELEGYRLHSRLTIAQVNPGDYGAYKCVSKNSLGETEGQIRLYGKMIGVTCHVACHVLHVPCAQHVWPNCCALYYCHVIGVCF